jgi:hypothetical protein
VISEPRIEAKFGDVPLFDSACDGSDNLLRLSKIGKKVRQL